MFSLNAWESDLAIPQYIVPDNVASSWKPLHMRMSGLEVGWGEVRWLGGNEGWEGELCLECKIKQIKKNKKSQSHFFQLYT